MSGVHRTTVNLILADATLEERLEARLQRRGGHRIWTGYVDAAGYGRIQTLGRPVGVHVAAWVLEHDNVAPGHAISPACGVRNCVDHLEQVLAGDVAPEPPLATRLRARTHCEHGHEFTPDNTGWRSPQLRRGRWIRYRYCMECMRQAQRRYAARRRQRRRGRARA